MSTASYEKRINNSRIGFVGLGNMGRHMVNNLIKAGYEVYVFDINPQSVKLCVEFGAHSVENLKQLMEICDIIHVAVLIDDQVKSVIAGENGLLQAAVPEKIIVINSSVSPQTVKEMADKAIQLGVKVVDAPMSGGEGGSKEGTLTFMVGSSEKEVFERILPILKSLGKHVFHLGNTGAGEVVKLATNLMGWCNNLIALEAVKLATEYGIEEDKLMEAARVSVGNSYHVENWDFGGKVMQTHTLAGTKDVYHFLTKDIDLAVKAANAVGLSLPIGALCAQLSPGILEERDQLNRNSGRIYTPLVESSQK